MNKSARGFTIVELLIVIVVIAILAAISIVAYTGIQNRAHDSAVRSDLSNIARRLQMYHAETGSYPSGGRVTTNGTSWTGSDRTLPGFTFRIARDSYERIVNNLSYCTGQSTASGQSAFRILARSQSGRYFEYSSMNGLVDRGTSFLPIYQHLNLCDDFTVHPRSYSYGYNNANGTWSNWIE